MLFWKKQVSFPVCKNRIEKMTKEEFRKRFPIKLNNQQWEAVQAVEGPTLLLAVPGSGKTTVLVARIGYMIYCCGVAPENIMTITYTRSAALDMKKRFAEIFGERMAAGLDFRTINSLCLDVIRYCAKGKKVYDIASDSKIAHILTEIYQKSEKEYPTEADLQAVKLRIAYIKNMMLSKDEIQAISEKEPFDLAVIYDEYNRVLKNNRQMDFDDQMVYALNLLNRFPEVLNHYQSRYPYFCVDEAQDTSKIQHRIIELLSAGTDNLFMVGDEDQSIYGFRAAYPKALLSFEKNHKNAGVLLMEENFRSAANIVSSADGFIRYNKLRHKKDLRATRPAGSEIKTVSMKGRRAQYTYLAKVAEDCEKETAVLYRNNESVIPLVDILERRGIDYRIKGGDFSFFSNRIIKDITDVIRLSSKPQDEETFMKVYYKINTYLRKNDAQCACAESRRRNIPIIDAAIEFCDLKPRTIGSLRSIRTHLTNIASDNGEKAVNRVVRFMGYGDYMERNNLDSSKVAIMKAIGANTDSPEELLQRLSYLQDILTDRENDNKCPFILSTIHLSKGLEYETVYMMDAVDGIFPESIPHDIAGLPEEELNDYEEERRIFYVGVTRAKDNLIIFEFGDGSTFTDQLLNRKKKQEAVPKKKQPELKIFNNSYSKPLLSDEKVISFLVKLGEGITVDHKKFGKGTIISADRERITIDFDGKRKIFNTAILASQDVLVIR